MKFNAEINSEEGGRISCDLYVTCGFTAMYCRQLMTIIMVVSVIALLTAGDSRLSEHNGH